ncbi:MAG: PIN domain-containing protein [Anaerolineae bacterium]|nr:PIN domain-containing protein [Anaerolineae bacterium]
MSDTPRKDALLLDTSFLYALADPSDVHREKAAIFARKDNAQRIIPDVVLTEAMYLVGRFMSHAAMTRFLHSIAYSSVQLEPVGREDLKQAHKIMTDYADARLDFVDCCIMALAERLNITRICTFDRRDFGLFKPTHCDYLELLP